VVVTVLVLVIGIAVEIVVVEVVGVLLVVAVPVGVVSYVFMLLVRALVMWVETFSMIVDVEVRGLARLAILYWYFLALVLGIDYPLMAHIGTASTSRIDIRSAQSCRYWLPFTLAVVGASVVHCGGVEIVAVVVLGRLIRASVSAAVSYAVS